MQIELHKCKVAKREPKATLLPEMKALYRPEMNEVLLPEI